MAKKIKFPLKLNEVDCRTLRDVQEHWNINEIYVYFADGRLLTWCRDRHYIEADKIVELSTDDSDVRKKLCEIFNVEYVADDFDSDDWRPKTLEEVEKYNRLKNYTADEEILKKFRQVAFDRDELDDLIDDYDEIYLCNNTFEEFPIGVKNKKYIGVGKVTIKIPNKEIVDSSIRFKNIKVTDVDDYPTPLPENPPKSQVEEWFESAEKAFNEKDYQTAFELFRKAADLGNADAMGCLGVMYEYGMEVEQNSYKAFELYQKAADLGDADAIESLADCYYFGKGTSQDIHKAVELFKKAADLGNDEAMYHLANMYYIGESVKKCVERAFELYRKAADLGNENAMNFLGLMYIRGEGTQQIVYKGINWLEKAVELGNVQAMKNLGDIYYNGIEVEKDKETAFKWYKKAAQAGDAEAMNYIGNMYYNGEGTEKNLNKAFELYQKAADLDFVPAMNSLGYYYFYKYEDNTSEMWFKKAMNKGYVPDGHDLSVLGDLYRRKGIEHNRPQDYQTAYRYYVQGANEGDADSMYGLGFMYHEGLGVNKDKKMAIAWLEQAAAKGHIAAKELLEKIKDKDCFITTAVCKSFNKPDDCFELTAFRNFRDNWLALQSDGKILIEEYYKIAPQIVANINKLTNANEIYKKLWYDWLNSCLEFIKVGDNVACKNKYVEMVQNLKKLYL